MDKYKQYNLPSQSNPSSFNNPQGEDFRSSPNVLETSKTLIIKQTFAANEKEAVFGKGQKVKRTATAANYTAILDDYYIGVTSTAAARTINLPPVSLAGVGKIYVVKDESGGAAANNITIDGNASETIDGATTKVINSNYGSVWLISSDTAWFTI